MPEPEIAVLAPTPCEWCSTGYYQRKLAEVQTATAVNGATARLCLACADAIGAGPRTALIPVADTLPLLADDQAAAYLTGQQWTTAKTVPEYPHAYVLLSRSTHPLAHLRTVRFIRHYGVRRQWAPESGPAAGRKVCSYWPLDGHVYWTQPSRTDPILNRKAAGVMPPGRRP